MSRPGVSGTTLDPQLESVLRDGLSHGLHLVFWGIAVMGVLSLFIAWRIPELERPAD